jgi:hypothetical protein
MAYSRIAHNLGIRWKYCAAGRSVVEQHESMVYGQASWWTLNPHPIAVALNPQAVAVIFYFVDPVGPVGNLGSGRG